MSSSVTQFCADLLGIEPKRPVGNQAAAGPVCWLCGGETGGQGWKQAAAIAPTFTQHNCAAAGDSDMVCCACVLFTRAAEFQAIVRAHGLALKLWPQAGWHSYSHLVTGAGRYEAPVPGRVRALLLEPPEPPFVLALNPSGQKHTLFRSRVTLDRRRVCVHCEERTFVVDPARFAALLAAFEAMGLLGFAREQTASGRYHPEAVRRAGLGAWRAGEAAVRPWREAEPDMMALAAWVARGPKWFAEHGQEAAA